VVQERRDQLALAVRRAGPQGYPLRPYDEQTYAWLRGGPEEGAGAYFLHPIAPLWGAAAALNVEGLPPWRGEPTTGPEALQALDDLAACLEEKTPIEIVPAGFRLDGGKVENLAGKPLAMLKVLLATSDGRLKAKDIRARVWPNNVLTNPEQAVKDTAKKLRQALRQALRRLGVRAPGDPLPSAGRGQELTYRLCLPALPER
jgi:hypothetical protein